MATPDRARPDRAINRDRDPEADLLELLAGLRSRDDTPAPEAAFVARLEGDLLGGSAAILDRGRVDGARRRPGLETPGYVDEVPPGLSTPVAASNGRSPWAADRSVLPMERPFAVAPVRNAARWTRWADVLAAAVLILAVGLGAVAARWFAPAGGVDGTSASVSGNAAATPPAADDADRAQPPRLLWRSELDDEGRVSSVELPVWSDGSVYLSGVLAELRGEDGFVASLDGATGAVRWRTALDSPWERSDASIPAVGDGVVVVGLAPRIVLDDGSGCSFYGCPWVDDAISGPGVLVGLDVTRGGERWRVETNGRIGGTAIADGIAYAAASDGTVIAVNALNGAMRWRHSVATTDDPALGLWPRTPLVSEGTVFVSLAALDGPSLLFAVDAATGTERWRHVADGWLSDPVVTRGVVVVETVPNDASAPTLLAFDAESGKKLWGKRGTGPVAADDLVVVWPAISGMTGMVAWDARSGDWRWRQPFEDGADVLVSSDIPGGVAVADQGALYASVVPAEWFFDASTPIVSALDPAAELPSEMLVAVDAASGEILWQMPLDTTDGSTSQPAVGDGLLVVSSWSGEVVGYRKR